MSRVNAPPSPALRGRVVSLHLHPAEPGGPLRSVQTIGAIQARGILQDARYFGRISRHTDQPTRRQVSLIERERLAEHAAALGLPSLPAGAARANIETLGLDLLACMGQQVRIGGAILLFHEPRVPCEKMDAVCAGLCELMKNNRQGVLAEVVRSGQIRVGDAIVPLQSD
jgi:hypothetical protein